MHAANTSHFAYAGRTRLSSVNSQFNTLKSTCTTCTMCTIPSRTRGQKLRVSLERENISSDDIFDPPICQQHYSRSIPCMTSTRNFIPHCLPSIYRQIPDDNLSIQNLQAASYANPHY